MFAKKLSALTVGCIVILSPFCLAVDEPQSEVSNDTEYALYNDPDGDITLTTDQLPYPDCPDDEADDTPNYFWDFGPLDGEDNDNGSATVHTDTDGSYEVTVYCSQEFKSNLDGHDYYEQTQTSN